MLQQKCKKCAVVFVIDEQDLEFYKKVGPEIKGQKFEIPPPTFCPDCRQQRRLSFRNEHFLYKRKSDFSGKEIVSIFSEDSPHKVYESDIWWSDKWDALEYGREYDFSRPFFEQFAELKMQVPHMALMNKNSENCEYTHLETDCKNCFMNFGGHYNEDSHYNLHLFNGKNCMDNYWVERAEFCYECFRCFDCYKLIYSYWCFNCNDCGFCYDCKGCTDCFGCVGLRRKRFCMFNEQLSEEEYKKRMKEIVLTPQKIEELKAKVGDLWNQSPHMNLIIEKSENCLGDVVKNCRNCDYVFETYDAEDCRYCDVAGLGMKDCYDITRAGFESELSYEVMAGTFVRNVLFSIMSFDHLYFSMYIDCCFSSKYLFGCSNLHHKEYCILNKQYTKDEWEELVPRIIKHMQTTGEWGEYFPSSLSPFGYNETVANEYFPLDKEGALSRGFKWKDADPKEYQPQSVEIAEDIRDVDDSILNQVLACKNCSKNYRIIKEELAIYKELGLPIPLKCFDCRHFERIKWRNPHYFWDRNCQRCHKEIKSTYAPERPEEKIMCEGCYLEEVV